MDRCIDCRRWASVRVGGSERVLCCHCAYVRLMNRRQIGLPGVGDVQPWPVVETHFTKGLPPKPAVKPVRDGKTWPELVAEFL